MVRVRKRCAVVALFVMAIAGGAAFASGYLEWDASLILQPVDPMFDLAASSSSIRVGYAWGDIGGGTRGAGFSAFGGGFGENGSSVDTTAGLPLQATDPGSLGVSLYHQSDLVIDWPVGTWGVLGNASFAMDPPSLTRLSGSVNVTAYGMAATAAGQLAPVAGGYAAGLTIDVSSTTLTGMGVSTSLLFGSMGGGPGAPPPASPCSLDFSRAVIGFEGFPLCCVHTDIDISFTCAGYEKTTIDVDVDLWDGVLTLDGALVFELQTKTFSLIPRLHVGQECIWVNVGIDPQGIGLGATTLIDRIMILGLGISNCEIGASDISLIVSTSGGLYKSRGAPDLDLHASGYYIALDPEASRAQYDLTDYTMVCTATQGTSVTELTIDVYFGMKNATLFDVALITAEWEYEVAAGLDFRLAAQFDPAGLEHRLLLGFSVEAPLP